jgi:hypothetical protein
MSPGSRFFWGNASQVSDCGNSGLLVPLSMVLNDASQSWGGANVCPIPDPRNPLLTLSVAASLGCLRKRTHLGDVQCRQMFGKTDPSVHSFIHSLIHSMRSYHILGSFFFFFFFYGIGVWMQDLHLEPLHQPYFCEEFFEIGSLMNYLLRLASNRNLPE